MMKFFKTKWGKFLIFFFVVIIIYIVPKINIIGHKKNEINEHYLTETSFQYSPSTFGGVYFRVFFYEDGRVEHQVWDTGVIGGSIGRYPIQYGKWEIIDSKSVRIIGTDVAGLYNYDERGLKSTSRQLARNKNRY